MKITAVFDTVIIKMALKDPSSIIMLTDGELKKSEYFTGRVVAIGPDYPDPTLQVGDEIVYPPHEGFAFTEGDEEYLTLSERWVLGKVIYDEA